MDKNEKRKINNKTKSARDIHRYWGVLSLKLIIRYEQPWKFWNIKN
jgi:hypothetical protein